MLLGDNQEVLLRSQMSPSSPVWMLSILWPFDLLPLVALLGAVVSCGRPFLLETLPTFALSVIVCFGINISMIYFLDVCSLLVAAYIIAWLLSKLACTKVCSSICSVAFVLGGAFWVLLIKIGLLITTAPRSVPVASSIWTSIGLDDTVVLPSGITCFPFSLVEEFFERELYQSVFIILTFLGFRWCCCFAIWHCLHLYIFLWGSILVFNVHIQHLQHFCTWFFKFWHHGHVFSFLW